MSDGDQAMKREARKPSESQAAGHESEPAIPLADTGQFPEPGPANSFRSLAGDDELAARASAFIQTHFAGPRGCSTADVARAVQVSPSHLCHRFRSTYGCTIGQQVRQLRIRLARRLLEDSDLLIKEVAADVGYLRSSYRTFLNAFRRETGVSPSEYRRVA